MNILIPVIIAYIVFSFYPLPARAAGQSGIISSSHRNHDVSVTTSPHTDAAGQDAGQGNVLRVMQKAHGLSVEIVPHAAPPVEKPAPQALPDRKKSAARPETIQPAPSHEEKHKRMLAGAWNMYKDAEYPGAINAFAQVANRTRDTGLQSNAYLGIGYSLKRLGNSADAKAVFELLVKRNYLPDETTPMLMEILVSLHEWKTAESYLDNMPGSKRAEWSRKIDEGRFMEQYTAVLKDGDTRKLVALVERNKHILNRCGLPEIFIKAASEMAAAGEEDAASGIYDALLQCGQEDWKLRLYIHHEMEKYLPVGRSLSSVKKEIAGDPWNSEYRSLLSELRMRLLKKRFIEADTGSPAYYDAGNEILALEPGNEDIRSIMAWNCFNAKDFECSERHFMALNMHHPYNTDHFKGLLYSLINAGSLQKALEALDRGGASPSDEMFTLRHAFYYQIAKSLYDDKKYIEAESPALKAVEMVPRDRDALTLLAWINYQQKKYAGALDLFKDAYRIDRSGESAEYIIMVLEKMNRDDAMNMLSDLSKEDGPLLRKTAADRYNERLGPITAAQTYEDEETCYYNCDTPVLELSGHFRDKSGDAGLSKLRELSFPLKIHYPVRTGREWAFSLTPVHLDAGSAPDTPYAGSYFRYINDGGSYRRSLTDALTVYEPEVTYRIEGRVGKEFMVGATPFNGVVDPMVRFRALITEKDRWYLKARQESVKESILSYVGQEDPYGDGKWGRVLKTGAGAGITYPLSAPYWSSFSAEFDYFWGEHVTDNYSVSGTVSAGRTDSILNGETNTGLFFTARHFNKNTSFFTYGHGGYFSPDVFYLAGPFFRYTKKKCCDFWFDGEVSAGYVSYRSGDAPHYHKVTDDESSLSASSRTDLNGEYSGETESGVGINIKLRAMKLIRDHIAVGGYLQENTSSDFNEFRLGLVLHYYFERMNKLCHTWDLFQRAEE